MENKADNLSNRQKGVFLEMRQAIGLKQYLDNMERIYKSAPPAIPENPAVIRNSPDSNK
jgi:hypothetical protein